MNQLYRLRGYVRPIGFGWIITTHEAWFYSDKPRCQTRGASLQNTFRNVRLLQPPRCQLALMFLLLAEHVKRFKQGDVVEAGCSCPSTASTHHSSLETECLQIFEVDLEPHSLAAS
jgi:hypothetical protein